MTPLTVCTNGFFEPKSFREALCQSRALVSGSIALQFFSGHRRETDLDIYVRSGMWAPLANFLMKSGYRETREGGRYKTVEVYNYQKGDQKVQVMQSYLDPVEAIHDFHSPWS